MPVDSESEGEENLQELRYKFHTDGGVDKFAALDRKNDEDDSDSISEARHGECQPSPTTRTSRSKTS